MVPEGVRIREVPLYARELVHKFVMMKKLQSRQLLLVVLHHTFSAVASQPGIKQLNYEMHSCI